MKKVTLTAHFDGTNIIPDMPAVLPQGKQFLLTIVIPDDDSAEERVDWLRFAAAGMAGCWDDDEPDYSDYEFPEQ